MTVLEGGIDVAKDLEKGVPDPVMGLFCWAALLVHLAVSVANSFCQGSQRCAESRCCPPLRETPAPA